MTFGRIAPEKKRKPDKKGPLKVVEASARAAKKEISPEEKAMQRYTELSERYDTTVADSSIYNMIFKVEKLHKEGKINQQGYEKAQKKLDEIIEKRRQMQQSNPNKRATEKIAELQNEFGQKTIEIHMINRIVDEELRFTEGKTPFTSLKDLYNSIEEELRMKKEYLNSEPGGRAFKNIVDLRNKFKEKGIDIMTIQNELFSKAVKKEEELNNGKVTMQQMKEFYADLEKEALEKAKKLK